MEVNMRRAIIKNSHVLLLTAALLLPATTQAQDSGSQAVNRNAKGSAVAGRARRREAR